jgi:hypothetical protein
VSGLNDITYMVSQDVQHTTGRRNSC